MPDPAAAMKKLVICRSLSPSAPPGDAPLALLAEIDGTPLYLHLQRAAIISLHHDASLLEVAAEVAPRCKTPRAFADALAKEGSGIDLDALLSLADAVADWKSFRPRTMAAEERARTIAVALGVTPRELAKRVRRRPTVFEWLGVEASMLDDLADGVTRAPRADKTQREPAPTLESIDTMPSSAASLRQLRALQVKNVLSAAQLRTLGQLTELEHLSVRLAPGATLPGTLVGLRTLTMYNGHLPTLPRLEKLAAWAPESLPKSLPALVELTWSPREEDFSAALKRVASYRALRRLALHNFWPAAKKIPASLRTLRGLEALRFLNCAYAADRDGIRALRKALPGCDVVAE